MSSGDLMLRESERDTCKYPGSQVKQSEVFMIRLLPRYSSMNSNIRLLIYVSATVPAMKKGGYTTIRGMCLPFFLSQPYY